MNAKKKCFTACCLVILILLSSMQVFVFNSSGQESDSEVERAYWMNLARTAWTYFQPGIGVNQWNGFHSSGLRWGYFTDWDLGVYLQAILDAEVLGIISTTDMWGADFRYEIILNFLETREQTPDGLPYALYGTELGQKSSSQKVNACDAGKLLVALHNLQVQKPHLNDRVNDIVYIKTNYTSFLYNWEQYISRLSLYDYYVTQGFSFFFPEHVSNISNYFLYNIAIAPIVETYGVKLPKASLTGEVILHCMFELPHNSLMSNIAQQVYLAHEARFNATGKYTAFSEGNTGLDNPGYIYEMVVNPDGRTWVITTGDGDSQIAPIIYLKVAVGFQALYNTAFTKNMVSYIVSNYPDTANGYRDGIDENGRVVPPTIDKTQGLIIGAAKYAISLLPPPPTPSPTPTPTPTYTPTPTPTYTPEPTPTPTPTFTPSPTATSSPTPNTTPPPPTPSPTPTNSPIASFSPSPNPTNGSSPSTSPTNNYSPSASPTNSPSPSDNPPTASPGTGNWQNEPTYIVLIAAVGCLFLSMPVLILIRRRGSRSSSGLKKTS